MATIGYAELPVPAGASAPSVVAALADLATVVDPHLVQHVNDLAERDSTLSTAPQHTLAIAADGTTWIKTDGGTNTWATVWEPLPDWQNVTLASGYQSSGGYTPQARLEGKKVSLRGRIERVDGTVIVNNGAKVGAVPTSCIPQVQVGSFPATCSLAGDVVIGTGKVEVLEVGTSSTLGVAGDITWWSQDGPTAGGTPWIAINGSYWID
ncbi:hypothetical protein PV383_43935 [Streptomyces caniscabiei]|uniref:Uncharacterized protein n=1 Tax=Streptomyces caniscabiei TaxID=2746961 RepID=A0ABU4N2R1_9ACTN|nr:hypothetical protein [Streptomyces caniscabiei]MDX3044065.1 hypothetical protein [Streptomyces caniscabiei]